MQFWAGLQSLAAISVAERLWNRRGAHANITPDFYKQIVESGACRKAYMWRAEWWRPSRWMRENPNMVCSQLKYRWARWHKWAQRHGWATPPLTSRPAACPQAHSAVTLLAALDANQYSGPSLRTFLFHDNFKPTRTPCYLFTSCGTQVLCTDILC